MYCCRLSFTGHLVVPSVKLFATSTDSQSFPTEAANKTHSMRCLTVVLASSANQFRVTSKHFSSSAYCAVDLAIFIWNILCVSYTRHATDAEVSEVTGCN